MGKREIDVSTWNRRSQYEWFKTFPDPTFEMTVRLDVTEVVRFSKETKTSFFINFLYLVSKAFNDNECTRIRYEQGHVYIYDKCDPTYTVTTKCGVFDNAGNEYTEDYKTFYVLAHDAVEKAKNETEVTPGYNSDVKWNDYYMTCLPNLDFIGVEHPIPSGNLESLSVPRICWGKFVDESGRYKMAFNIVMSHMLVDGLPAGNVINTVQAYCNDAYQLLK